MKNMKMMSDETVRCVTSEEVSLFQEHGWVYLTHLVSSDFVSQVLQELQSMMGIMAEFGKKQASEHFANMWRTLDEPSHQNKFLWDFVTSPRIGLVTSRMLRDVSVRFFRDEVYVKMPTSIGEGKRTPWHQDFPFSSRDRSQQVSIWLALNDIPPERGTLRYLSGSHRFGVLGRALDSCENDLVAQYPKLLSDCEISPPIHIHPGDALVHHGLVVHSASQNVTNEPRWAYAFTLFQADALYTGIPLRPTSKFSGLVPNQPFDHPLTPVVWPVQG